MADTVAAAAPVIDAKLRGNLLRQLEYYMADIALPFDDFLLAACQRGGLFLFLVCLGLFTGLEDSLVL